VILKYKREIEREEEIDIHIYHILYTYNNFDYLPYTFPE